MGRLVKHDAGAVHRASRVQPDAGTLNIVSQWGIGTSRACSTRRWSAATCSNSRLAWLTDSCIARRPRAARSARARARTGAPSAPARSRARVPGDRSSSLDRAQLLRVRWNRCALGPAMRHGPLAPGAICARSAPIAVAGGQVPRRAQMSYSSRFACAAFPCRMPCEHILDRRSLKISARSGSIVADREQRQVENGSGATHRGVVAGNGAAKRGSGVDQLPAVGSLHVR